MEAVFVAKRRFDPSAGDTWRRFVDWSGLGQLREVVSLDGMLCPTVPEELIAADWEHNVHADYQISYFRSLDYLQARWLVRRASTFLRCSRAHRHKISRP